MIIKFFPDDYFSIEATYFRHDLTVVKMWSDRLICFYDLMNFMIIETEIFVKCLLDSDTDEVDVKSRYYK